MLLLHVSGQEGSISGSRVLTLRTPLPPSSGLLRSLAAGTVCFLTIWSCRSSSLRFLASRFSRSTFDLAYFASAGAA